ncbi:MAG: signal peptidase II [Myxococcales bacterium]|nr:signal peptidase II [Myxococcales bacterium]
MSDESKETEATVATSDDAAPAPSPAVEAAAPDAAKTTVSPGRTAGDWAFLAVVSFGTAVADLWSKHWALNALSRTSSSPPPLCTPPAGMSHYLPQRVGTRDVTWIRDYLDLQYAENCGGAWGLLHGASEAVRKPFFLLVTLGAIAFIVHLYRGLEKGQTAMKWALPLVLGGAIGNLVDRVRLGYVVDFIHAHWRDKAHWPTFNVADIAITVGIGLMVLEYIVGPKEEPKPKKKAAPQVEARAEATVETPSP